MEFNPPGRAHQPVQQPRLDKHPAPEGTVWLNHWRGRKFKTKKQVIAARCQHCDYGYEVPGSDLNELASKTGAWGKFTLVMDTTSMIETSRNVASDDAGKQLRLSRARAEYDQTNGNWENAVRAVLCPACGSNQILFEAPSDGPAPTLLMHKLSNGSRITVAAAQARLDARSKERQSPDLQATPHTEVPAEERHSAEPQAAPAAWYSDPHDPTQLRYWDGSTWTQHTHRYAA